MNKIKVTSEYLAASAIDALQKDLVLLKKQFFNFRFQKSMGDSLDTSQFRQIRKKIARIATELTKRKRGENA